MWLRLPPRFRIQHQLFTMLTCWAIIAAPACAQERNGAAAGVAVPVRYSEGTAHGFLTLRAEDGTRIADGALLQVPRERNIESRLVFRFRDSSLHDERVVFSQHGVFVLESYHLEQRGPAFTSDLTVSLSKGGKYEVTATSHEDGAAKHFTGQLDLPADVANGLAIIFAKNLKASETRTVHAVAFTQPCMGSDRCCRRVRPVSWSALHGPNLADRPD